VDFYLLDIRKAFEEIRQSINTSNLQFIERYKNMSVKHKIKVLVVDDSLLFREMIRSGIEADEMIEVVDVAENAEEAIKKIQMYQPDVMTLDIEMPGMTGIELLEKIMPTHPMPVVMVSSLSECVFDAMKAGAVDFVTKPDIDNFQGSRRMCTELSIKIKIASMAKIRPKKIITPQQIKNKNDAIKNGHKIIAIGASTGGTEAIYDVLTELPREMPGIVIVQHMPEKFTTLYADRLNRACQIEVREAKDGDIILPGLALLAPGGYQMEVEKKRNYAQVRCVKSGKVNGHQPAVDVLFDSVAKHFGQDAMGIILTGMGKDGASGLKNMRDCGARTVGQNEASCVVYGMPKAAYLMGGVEQQLPLDRIAQRMKQLINE
jgi:two-component system chemotaxis response regulator CheB